MRDMTGPSATGNIKHETGEIIKLAILAVGGQGGGVLADWITAVAEHNGYRAQSTSVAGVAQRTGATIYYVEMCRDTGRMPVFALAPAQGDVDILIAAELMEAGRAVMRGFVTPNRTTLIASSHRIAAVSEKIEPGDGRAAPDQVMATMKNAARHLVCLDLEKVALEAGSMISASLFGALAASGALPFNRESYESVLNSSGRGAAASMRAFGAAYDQTSKAGQAEPAAATEARPIGKQAKGPPRLLAKWQQLNARVAAYPMPVQDMALRGLRKVTDYQDLAYGSEYLDRLDLAVKADLAAEAYALSIAAAKHLANAMCYDDMIRVADLKTRSKRDRRVRSEVGIDDAAVLQLTEYFHPRAEEFCGTLPLAIGRYIEKRPQLFAWVDRRINRGRHIRTDSMSGFAMLWFVGGLRRWRRSLLRHQVEMDHLQRWYKLALDHAADDYALGVEIINCRRLIKGYSDTHVRGQSKFDRVLSSLDDLRGRADAADWIRRLREAALKDEKGTALDGALKTVASFSR